MVYLTQRNADLTEGRGPMVIDKCFANKKHAEDYIDAQTGVQNRTGPWSNKEDGDWIVTPIKVYYKAVDAVKENNEKLKKSALAKLTPAEKKALGL